jgi:hypothetical protein
MRPETEPNIGILFISDNEQYPVKLAVMNHPLAQTVKRNVA